MDREETPNSNIANTIKDLELTREYCRSWGITDEHDVKKIQWLVSHHIRVHGMEGALEELERRVSQAKRKTDLESEERILTANVSARNLIDGIRPWQGTKKERKIAQQNLDKQSKWMEHNEKWLNEAGILPNAEDIQKANKPYDPAQIISAHHPDLKNAVKQYAHAMQRVDELKALIDPLQLELEEAQKALNEWHTKTINILNTANHKFQKWMGSE